MSQNQDFTMIAGFILPLSVDKMLIWTEYFSYYMELGFDTSEQIFDIF